MRQVERGHWSNEAKEYYYAKRAAALGVRNREDSLKQNSTDTPNGATVPSQEEHADALGVGHRTVSRWEKDQRRSCLTQNYLPKPQHQRATKKLRRSLETDVKQSREKACYTPSHLSSSRTTSY